MRRGPERCCSPSKSLGRLACILQALFLGACVNGSLFILAFYPRTVMQHIPILINKRVSKYAVYYGLPFSTLTLIPFLLVSMLGTRSKSLIICCMISNALVFLHLAILWIACLIVDGPIKGTEMIIPLVVGIVVLTFQILTATAILSTLQTRNWEEAIALHSAQFLRREKNENELVIL